MRILSHNPKYQFEGRDDSKTDAVVVREIFCENVYEVAERDLQDTGVVIDLGANIGAFGVYCHSLIPDKNPKDNAIRVYAFEPQPDNFELLQKNIKLNDLEGTIIPIQKAVGSHEGTALITNEHGDSRIVKNKTLAEGDEARVEMITLERALMECGVAYADILKLDIEGYEGKVLLNTSEEVMGKFAYIVLEFDQNATDFGDIVTKLSETHQVKTVGSHRRGAQIFARRY